MPTTRHFDYGTISEIVRGPKLFNSTKFHAFYEKVNDTPLQFT